MENLQYWKKGEASFVSFWRIWFPLWLAQPTCIWPQGTKTILMSMMISWWVWLFTWRGSNNNNNNKTGNYEGVTHSTHSDLTANQAMGNAWITQCKNWKMILLNGWVTWGLVINSTITGMWKSPHTRPLQEINRKWIMLIMMTHDMWWRLEK